MALNFDSFGEELKNCVVSKLWWFLPALKKKENSVWLAMDSVPIYNQKLM